MNAKQARAVAAALAGEVYKALDGTEDARERQRLRRLLTRAATLEAYLKETRPAARK